VTVLFPDVRQRSLPRSRRRCRFSRSRASRRSVYEETNTAEARTRSKAASNSSRAPNAVLDAILPAYIHFAVYQTLLGSRASEQSARMVAMKSATDNAKNLVKDLTLGVRQGPPGQHHERDPRNLDRPARAGVSLLNPDPTISCHRGLRDHRRTGNEPPKVRDGLIP